MRGSSGVLVIYDFKLEHLAISRNGQGESICTIHDFGETLESTLKENPRVAKSHPHHQRRIPIS